MMIHSLNHSSCIGSMHDWENYEMIMNTTSSKNRKSLKQNWWLHAREDPSHQPCTCMKKLHNKNNIINLNIGGLVIITPTLKEGEGFWRLSMRSVGGFLSMRSVGGFLSIRSVGGFLCIFFKSKRDLKE